MEHAIETEREGDAADKRRQVIAGHSPRKGMRCERAKQVREQPDDVVGERGIARGGIDGKRERADAQQVLAVGQRVRCRVENVGVEDRRPVEQGMVHPRKRPDIEPRI